jgi:hypothetical protein
MYNVLYVCNNCVQSKYMNFEFLTLVQFVSKMYIYTCDHPCLQYKVILYRNNSRDYHASTDLIPIQSRQWRLTLLRLTVSIDEPWLNEQNQSTWLVEQTF